MVSESRLGTSSCLLTTLINQAIKKITEQLLLSKFSYVTVHRIFLASRLITSLTITINILAQRNKQNKALQNNPVQKISRICTFLSRKRKIN